MTAEDTRTALERDFNEAINELQSSLQQAADASARIQTLIPRIGSITDLFDELDAVIRSGRAQIGAATAAPASYSRPTLVVPSTPSADSQPQPTAVSAAQTSDATRGTTLAPATFEPANTAGLTSFRLEFESRPGPLDLRTVDDAVSDHPAVRDVALLDYDGRKATLKVWIDASTSPADVQSALAARSTEIFPSGNDVTIVALEDVA